MSARVVRRRCTVDGTRYASISEAERELGLGQTTLYFLIRRHGSDFTYKGRHVVTEERSDAEKLQRRKHPGKPPRIAGYAVATEAPPPAPEPIVRALADRKAYDEHGVAHAGVLVRRKA